MAPPRAVCRSEWIPPGGAQEGACGATAGLPVGGVTAGMGGAPRDPIVVWRFSDGRRGHDEQTLALCEALAQLTPTRRHDVPAGAATLPEDTAPTVLMGAGHRTHLPMLAARRRRGGHAVVVMRPTLPLWLFDSAIVPQHDRPPRRPGVLATAGALNRVRPRRGSAQQGLVLIGGPSRHFHWDEQALLNAIATVLDREPDCRWLVASSPRTPDRTTTALRALAGARFVHHRDAPPGWLQQAVANAGRCWVTADSVSMLHEALSAMCAVGVLTLPPRRRSRVAQAVQALVASGRVRTWEQWTAGTPLVAHEPLREAERAARWLLERVAPERLGR